LDTRDLSISNPGAKKFGGYDPYLDHYVLSVGEEPIRVYNATKMVIQLSNQKNRLLLHDLRLQRFQRGYFAELQLLRG
jgi:hypothetical protein